MEAPCISGVRDRPNSSLFSQKRSATVLIIKKKKVINGSTLGGKFMVIFPWFHVQYSSRKHGTFSWQLQSAWWMGLALRPIKSNPQKIENFFLWSDQSSRSGSYAALCTNNHISCRLFTGPPPWKTTSFFKKKPTTTFTSSLMYNPASY